MPDRKLAYASTGDVMAAMAHHDACAQVQNLTSEALDILIVLRKALCEDRGGLIEEDKDAALTVLSIAEQRARAAYVAAKAVAQTTEEALRA